MVKVSFRRDEDCEQKEKASTIKVLLLRVCVKALIYVIMEHSDENFREA
jgi:hypothetical protein